MSRFWSVLITGLLLVTSVEAEVLVPASSSWRYFKGTSEASSPDTTAWRSAAFNDTPWPAGNAPFYYGEAVTGGTVLNDMRNNYSTVFLRREFNIGNLSQITAADLDVRCDDGFVAWINGQEVASRNAPATITFDAVASGNAPEPANFETFPAPLAALRAGENILAIQLFNISLTGSSDALLDAQLITKERETISPTITRVIPAQGAVTNLTQIAVSFSELVTGVNASDLSINGLGAATVTGSGSNYVFTFPQPLYGDVVISWSIDANITDLAVPPNPFDRSDPAATFFYDLVDPSVPMVASAYPPGGITISHLSHVEVLFNKIVEGVDAADLLINGQPATNLLGFGAGPYAFTFPTQPNGQVAIAWAQNHGIRDLTERQNPFVGTAWTYTLNSAQPARRIRINEVMAANINGIFDQDGANEDWIELYNEEDVPVSLEGWSLTDDPTKPAQWVFPRISIGPREYLVVFVSGKDIRDPAAPRLHTNFKLNLLGEYLGLYSPDAPRRVVSEFAPEYPEQRNDYSYGFTSSSQLRYFQSPTPGAANGASLIADVVQPVYFSVERGFYNTPFQLTLHCPTPSSLIRYTLDGSEPTATTGLEYNGPVTIDRTRMVRAAAFRANSLPSVTRTHTYLYNIPASRLRLPALSLVTATNHLFGQTGIMEVNPRNTTKHGIAWERPVSVELINPEDNSGFQIDCGIRIQGGGYIRERYDYRTTSLPVSKYSFRLYFRGDYGAGKLDYPFFPGLPLESFDEIVLRSGMNDHSNPFIRDEMVRMLSADAGMVASHGTFVHLFLDGVYKGLYNPTERISSKFLQAWHGAGELWDLIAQNGEIRDGNAIAWNQLRSLANTQNPANRSTYEQISERLDIDNYIDYLLVNIYAGSQDWPYNNWRAGRERAPGGKFRFYVWDAEWSFGYNNGPSHNTIANELAGTSEIPTLFRRLRLSPEFRLRFADRAHKHFYNRGALTDEMVRARYESIRSQVVSSISGFNNVMSTTWIAQRRRYVTNHLASARLLLSSNAPSFNLPFGRVSRAVPLTMSAGTGEIYYTTNGIDPRVPFTGELHPDARQYTAPLALNESTLIKARTLWSTNWSALTEGVFQLEQLGVPIRITELMYNPAGGDAYEYLELQNVGPSPINLGGFTFEGINFRFLEDGRVINPGARIILSSSADPAWFAQRYPQIQVFGAYTGALNNGGESIILRDPAGNIVTMVEYDDENAWPSAADGDGYSIELIDLHGDPSAVSNWKTSAQVGGSPGVANSFPSSGAVRLNEIFASGNPTNTAGASDWLELHNTTSAPVDLSSWSISDDSNPRRFVFPAGTSIPANGFLVVWCDALTNAPGLHSGFALSAREETVFLYDAAVTRVDAVTYGLQPPNFTLGRAEVNNLWTLTVPTSGSRNEAIALSTNIVINEVFPNPLPGEDDWIELHNFDTNLPAAIGGYYLAISNQFSRLPDLSFVGVGGYVQIFADENYGADHVNFKLPATGATVALSDNSGAELDRITYTVTREGMSLGRLPNGAGPLTPFPASASPGAPNYLPEPNGVQFWEVLANTTSPGWIEIHNPLPTAVDFAGMSISLDEAEPNRWVLPPGATITAGGFISIFCDPVNTNRPTGLNIPEALNPKGGAVYLFDRSGQVADFVKFGAQIPSMSIGRSGTAWALMANPTQGTANTLPAPLGDPRLVRFNEWMAGPFAGDDWIELFNPQSAPVDIGGFFITDDPSLSGRTNTEISQLTFIAPNGFILLQADNELDRGPEHLGFSLELFGETLRLYNGASVIDEVAYLPQTPEVSEGRVPDGGANILRFPGLATPNGPNVPPSTDTDNDGMPDDWESTYGLNPGSPADALLDNDGDGMSNLDEFRAGTNPTSAASSLALDFRIDESGAVLLRFNAAVNKTYTILGSDALTGAIWSRVSDITAGPEREVALPLDGLSQPGSTRFYRIVSPMQP